MGRRLEEKAGRIWALFKWLLIGNSLWGRAHVHKDPKPRLDGSRVPGVSTVCGRDASEAKQDLS